MYDFLSNNIRYVDFKLRSTKECLNCAQWTEIFLSPKLSILRTTGLNQLHVRQAFWMWRQAIKKTQSFLIVLSTGKLMLP